MFHFRIDSIRHGGVPGRAARTTNGHGPAVFSASVQQASPGRGRQPVPEARVTSAHFFSSPSLHSGGRADLGGPGDPLQVLEGVVAAVHASVDQG